VLEENAEQDGGIVTGKLFEMVGVRVPVLFIGPRGADVDHIMVSFLEDVMSGKSVKVENPDMYAWPNIVRTLDDVLRGALK
jgi:hypothetical protein